MAARSNVRMWDYIRKAARGDLPEVGRLVLLQPGKARARESIAQREVLRLVAPDRPPKQKLVFAWELELAAVTLGPASLGASAKEAAWKTSAWTRVSEAG
jgi:hypothetical protein